MNELNETEVNSIKLWHRYNNWFKWYPQIHLGLDISKVKFSYDWLEGLTGPLKEAIQYMKEIEAGAMANVSERRMVGHYWLRAPDLAPSDEIKEQIISSIQAVKKFSTDIINGKICGQGGKFYQFLWIGIGGSILGPQMLWHALWHPRYTKMNGYFIDNTDPDGIDRILNLLEGKLGQTLCIVVSKSGKTPETHNGMVRVRQAYEAAGLDFHKHAVAITQPNLDLDKQAKAENWLISFPIWEWVGGRTSITSVVGLLPLALMGGDIDQFLLGARKCDELTRSIISTDRPISFMENPAAAMAAMWYFLTDGRGSKNMVVLPYKDRLEWFPRYLQQLVMESLGKKQALDGRFVYQGLTVYGNKGSTDQHAYVQQLRDGLNDFFVTFIEVLQESWDSIQEIEPGTTAGDYLEGFFLGTRKALFDAGRQSITLTIADISPYSLGALVALFERTVGIYAKLININAYDQPGVEAGKKAAAQVLKLQQIIVNFLNTNRSKVFSVEEIAAGLASSQSQIAPERHLEEIYKICERLAFNKRFGITRIDGPRPCDVKFGII